MAEANWKHQAYEFKVGREKKSRALLWPMRSGKSKACIQKALFNFDHEVIEGALIIAPNGVHVNWVLNEIPKWAGPGQARFAWETQRRGDQEFMQGMHRMLAAPGMKWLAVSKDALRHTAGQKAIRMFIRACHRKFMMITDESHHFGHAGSFQTLKARSLAKLATVRMITTGTVTLNSPLRAFSQFELLEPGALGFKNYDEFKSQYAIYDDRRRKGNKQLYKKLSGFKNLEDLTARMAKWSSVVVREDIHDMPNLIRTERPILMSDVQRRHYIEMVNEHLLEIGENEITAPDAGARFTKLSQLVSGYILDASGKPHVIDEAAPIFDAMLQEVAGTQGKCIVWCRFRFECEKIVALLEEKNYGVVQFHGGVPLGEREPNRLRFQNDPAVRVMVGTVGTGGEGLDFSAADAIIYLSIPPNAVAIRQSEERATVKGGRSVAIVRLRTHGTVDDRLWEIVDTNTALAETVSGRGLRDLLMQTDI